MPPNYLKFDQNDAKCRQMPPKFRCRDAAMPPAAWKNYAANAAIAATQMPPMPPCRQLFEMPASCISLVFSPILGSKVKNFRLRRARKVNFFFCGSKKRNFSPAASSKGKSFFLRPAQQGIFFACGGLDKKNFRL